MSVFLKGIRSKVSVFSLWKYRMERMHSWALAQALPLSGPSLLKKAEAFSEPKRSELSQRGRPASCLLWTQLPYPAPFDSPEKQQPDCSACRTSWGEEQDEGGRGLVRSGVKHWSVNPQGFLHRSASSSGSLGLLESSDSSTNCLPCPLLKEGTM